MRPPSLSTFSLTDMISVGAALRVCGRGSESCEAAAGEVVRYLHEGLVSDGQRETTLVRYYQTVPFAELEPDLQAFASAAMGSAGDVWDELPCLTLLASAGVEPHWNNRLRSSGHRTIPLPSAEAVARLPMIAQLIGQLGLELAALIEPDPDLLVDLDQKQYNVFHVPQALGSPFIPAQDDFVVPYAVESALGFGGMLPSGDMFAVVIFSRVPIPRETANLFRTVALSVKVGLLPLVGRTFEVTG